jgi:hypothetical protein
MVIHSWHAARLIRQHRPNDRPLIVREFVAHDSAPLSGGLHHGSAVRLNISRQKDRSLAVHPKAVQFMPNLSFVGRDRERACTLTQ